MRLEAGPAGMGLRRWLGLVVGDGLTAARDAAPRIALPTLRRDRAPARRLVVPPGGRRASQPGAAAVDVPRIIEALRQTLCGGGVPAARTERALRATEMLLCRAVTVRADGCVFVTTGDIPAMWLRDSAAQVAPLLALARDVPEVAQLVAGVLRTQVEQVLVDPRANAFNAEPSGFAIRRDFADQSAWVFERKYAVDSLCAPLSLAWRLWGATGSAEHLDPRFREAARTIVSLWRDEQEHDPGSYRFHRRLARREDSLSHGGGGVLRSAVRA